MLSTVHSMVTDDLSGIVATLSILVTEMVLWTIKHCEMHSG